MAEISSKTSAPNLGQTTREAVPLERYSVPFLERTQEGLQQMDQRIRKLITMQKTLHLRDAVDRLYVLRKEEERGHASIQDSIDVSI